MPDSTGSLHSVALWIDRKAEKIGRWGARRLVYLLILAGPANNASSLWYGFQYDDYLHQLVLRGRARESPGHVWNLYDFGPRPNSAFPQAEWRFHVWWAVSDFKVRFFRPVTSLTIAIDYWIFGGWAPGYHIASLLYLAVALGLAFALYRDLGAPNSAALWALAVLALSPVHLVPAGWIANRNTVLATLFVIATLRAIHRFRRTGGRGWFAVAIVCFLLGCGSKESGLVALPLMALYLFFFDRRDEGESVAVGLRRLARSHTLWTFAVISGVYLATYVALGFGTRSVVYPTPWADPLLCGFRLAVLVPVGLLGLFFGFPADVIPAYPWLTWPVALAAIPFLIGFGAVLLRVTGRTPQALFALAWALCSLLVETGADISDRLLVNAAVGTALLVGLFLQRLTPIVDRVAGRQYAPLVLGGMLFASGIVSPIPAMIARSYHFNMMAATDRALILNADIDRAAPAPRSVFIVNCPSSLLALSLSATWGVTYNDLDTYVFPLQMGRRAVRWNRDGPNSMTLTSRGAPFTDHRLERIFCTSTRAPGPGTVFRGPEFEATVLVTEPAGFHAVRFEFKRNLDDPSYRFLAWREGRMTAIRPPAIGQTVELPEVPSLSPFAI